MGYSVKNGKEVIYQMNITPSHSKVRLEGEGELNKFKARINSRLLEWYSHEDEKIILWTSDPLPPIDQEHLAEVKHEFENLDTDNIGFIERDKCKLDGWEYKPGGK